MSRIESNKFTDLEDDQPLNLKPKVRKSCKVFRYGKEEYYDDEKRVVKRVLFPRVYKGELFALQFGKLMTVTSAIKRAEEYLSKPITKDYYEDLETSSEYATGHLLPLKEVLGKNRATLLRSETDLEEVSLGESDLILETYS